LSDPRIRLISIVGAGGVGKTRLVQNYLLELGSALQNMYQDGIFFIDLSGLVSPDFLVPSLSDALQFELDSNWRDHRTDLQQLSDFLSKKKLLLILDNFEQILPGAETIGHLLQQTRHLRILVTSRARLGLSGEQLLPVEGLNFPQALEYFPQDVSQFDAVRLFLVHAKRIQPDFQVGEQNWHDLARICRITEGNSLAIELAAAWVDTLSVKDIADDIETGFRLLEKRDPVSVDRHRSMQRIFDASFQNLGEKERTTFSRLCIFQGGFSRQAGEIVADLTIPVLSLLTQKGLIKLDHIAGKYRIHELLRQFGYNGLIESGLISETGWAHFKYFTDFVISTEPYLHGPQQTIYLDGLDHDLENIRLALDWGIHHPEYSDNLMDMIVSITWYWRMRSYMTEAFNWLQKIRQNVVLSQLGSAKFGMVIGHHEWMRGNFTDARAFLLKSKATLESLGLSVSKEMGKVNVSLGMVESGARNDPESMQYFERALDIFSTLGDDWFTAFTLGWLALPQHALGHKQAARQSIMECIQMYRLLGDRWALGLNLHHFAEMEWENGHADQAEEYALEALDLERSTNHLHSVGQTLMLLGRVARKREQIERAKEFYQQSLEIFIQLGHLVFAKQVRGEIREIM
jgi:predicted ATPase